MLHESDRDGEVSHYFKAGSVGILGHRNRPTSKAHPCDCLGCLEPQLVQFGPAKVVPLCPSCYEQDSYAPMTQVTVKAQMTVETDDITIGPIREVDWFFKNLYFLEM